MKKKFLKMISVVCVFTMFATCVYAAPKGPNMDQPQANEAVTTFTRSNPETMTATAIVEELYHNMGSTELVRCAKDNAALLTGEKAVVDDSGYMFIGTYQDSSVMNDVAYPLGTSLQAIGVRSDGKYDALLAYTDYPTAEKAEANKAALNLLYNTAWDLKEATDSMNDRETVSYIANWIHSNLTYKSGLEGQPATCLSNKTADCDGYAALFHVFATFCDIPTIEVVGTWRGGAHGWNRVYIDDAWLNVDAIANRTLFTAEEAAASQYVETPFMFDNLENAKKSGHVIQ